MINPDTNIENSIVEVTEPKEFTLEETTNLSELALIELKETNLPVIEVFNLVKLGNTTKQIADLLGLYPKQVTTIKSLGCYKQLKQEWAEEQQELSQVYVSKQITSYQTLANKAASRLEELMQSENEKVAIEASKFIVTTINGLHKDQVDDKITQLEQTINVILDGENPATIDVEGDYV